MQSISTYFNHVIGLIVFTITLTCLGFNDPQTAAIFSFPVILFLFSASPKGTELVLVRALINNHENQEEKEIFSKELEGFIKSQNSFLKSLKESYMYLYGTMFYTIVLLSNDFGLWFRS
jgi:hypothetical protein